MANFERFLPLLLKFEGGYVMNPDDPGGETNKGITLHTFASCARTLLGLDPTPANLRALTDEQAGTIYRTRYWNAILGDEIASQDLANMVCDFYVNAGTHATTLLQTAINEAGAASGVRIAVDGAIGEATLKALHTLDPVAVYSAYRRGRIAYYQQLGVKYPMFLAGWLKRVESFPDRPSGLEILAVALLDVA
ncbi:glycoside hydrolase family 108 protein [Silvibacterium sp.]|uniref:glycoside hydrolase family 108 protein n=1 Tax=Silvibacterium sp. TaxID=1964179 RepID=UPI0039E4C26B